MSDKPNAGVSSEKMRWDVFSALVVVVAVVTVLGIVFLAYIFG